MGMREERKSERRRELTHLRPEHANPYDNIARYIISGIVEMRKLQLRGSEEFTPDDCY